MIKTSFDLRSCMQSFVFNWVCFDCEFDCLSFQRWATRRSITRRPAAIEMHSQIAADICLEIF